MKNLRLYEEFEGEEFQSGEYEGYGKYKELDNDQDFDVDVEFHEFINDWEKEHAIPMTKQELKIQFSTEAIESVINQFWNRDNKVSSSELVKSKLAQLAEIDSPLSKFFDTLKSKYDWYDDSLGYAVLSKIYQMVLLHDEAEDVEWSQDDPEYMTVSGEDEYDDLEELRQRSLDKYAKEDEDERKEDEIYAKVKQGIKSGKKYQLPEEEEDYLQRKADKFLKRYEMKNIKGFKSFKY